MLFNYNKIQELEEKQYSELFSSNFWDYNFVKHNFPINIGKYKKLFKTYDEYFKIYMNDYRESINIREFYLLMALRSNNPNTLFHSLYNFLPITRFRSSSELIESINNLEIRGYIRIDRNHDKDKIFNSYNARKQFIVKIVAVDTSGKELTISYSEKKRRNKINIIKKKFVR